MLELVSSHACHGGEQRFYRHDSAAIGLPMKFSVYLPPQAAHGRVPALFYLAGLTCTDETFAIKAGAQQYAAQHGVALVMPDTSPRGAGVPGETDAWDFGVGAGFYVDATEAPWSAHYRMESYVTGELRELVAAELPIDGARLGIFGHSMGGHGALTLALRHPACTGRCRRSRRSPRRRAARGARRRSRVISATIATRGKRTTRANSLRAPMRRSSRTASWSTRASPINSSRTS